MDTEAHEVENIVDEAVENRAAMKEEEDAVATRESSTLLAKILMDRNQFSLLMLPIPARKVDSRVTIDLLEWLKVKASQRKNRKSSSPLQIKSLMRYLATLGPTRRQRTTRILRI